MGYLSDFDIQSKSELQQIDMEKRDEIIRKLKMIEGDYFLLS